jgi:hypothetical protein
MDVSPRSMFTLTGLKINEISCSLFYRSAVEIDHLLNLMGVHPAFDVDHVRCEFQL